MMLRPSGETLLQWQREAVRRAGVGDWCLFIEVSRLRTLMPKQFAELPPDPSERVMQLFGGLEAPTHRFDAEMPYLGGRHGELYKQYLQTPHWRAFRANVLARARGYCAQCRESRQLEVHHLHYETLGDERESDVSALCHECHEAEHGREW